jgi:branched-chain amino acid transport system ATP-binding protein
MRALDVIRGEHRSLAAVIHGLRHLVREVREHGARPDFGLLEAMLRYIDAFPELLHHPKEDRYLFRLLRERDPASARVLDELEADHAMGARAIRELDAALGRYRDDGAAGFPMFAGLVDAYAAFHWEHMRKEEVEVMPAAERHLLPEDWAEIDAAFGSHGDPLLGADVETEFGTLFRRIVDLAPPPIGVGPAVPGK